MNEVCVPPLADWERFAEAMEEPGCGPDLQKIAAKTDWRVAPKGRRKTLGIRGWTAKPLQQAALKVNCGWLGMNLAEATWNLLHKMKAEAIVVQLKAGEDQGEADDEAQVSPEEAEV